MAVAVTALDPSVTAATVADVQQSKIHDLKAALAAAAALAANAAAAEEMLNDAGDDIIPSVAATPISWSMDTFLDTSEDLPMEPGPFEGPEKLLEIHFSPAMQDVQHIRTPLNNNTSTTAADFIDYTGDMDWYGLRIIPKAVWEEMLDIVQCKVLHSIHHPTVDAYVLSESSFFVFPHKLILKTCGTTTLLMALPKTLELAQEWCRLLQPSSSPASTSGGLQLQPYRIFYSRKKLLFPEKQVHVHREWKDEVEFLDRHFENGAAYTIGEVNGDHWRLYLTAPFLPIQQRKQDTEKGDETVMENFQEEGDAIRGGLFGLLPTRPLSRTSSSTSSTASSVIGDSESEDATSVTLDAVETDYDQTIEILMTDLNPKAMRKFYHHSDKDQSSGSEGGESVDRLTGLANLFPETEIDSFLFTPCGYSANALVKSKQGDANATTMVPGKYFTIHVTPEPVCSYASFETNIPVCLTSKCSKKTRTATISKGTAPETVQELIQRVVEIFQPGNLTVTVFASSRSGASEYEVERRQRKMLHSLSTVPGFHRTDRILYGLDGYDLVYGHYLAV
ncbi:spermidine resistance protein [Mortierella sp. AD031]|nr:spermidine resistance protein [Mortierella sp. AD031]